MSRIQKVIIAEDVKSIHQGLASVLQEINIAALKVYLNFIQISMKLLKKY